MKRVIEEMDVDEERFKDFDVHACHSWMSGRAKQTNVYIKLGNFTKST